MSILPENAPICVINEPVSGRKGIPGLMAMLYGGEFDVNWDQFSPITIVTFNASLTLCKLLIIDVFGVSCMTRKLTGAKFKNTLKRGLLPLYIRRSDLEHLLATGTIYESYEQLQL